MTFFYSKIYTFLKIKEIGCIKLISYIYAYPKFSKPLSKLVDKNVTISSMEFKDYEIKRDIYDKASSAEPEHPNDMQTSLREPVVFFLEYFVVPAVIFLSANVTILLLIYRIMT